MMPVFADKDSGRRHAALDTMVMLGAIGKWVPLNGGSDTRADARDWWRQSAAGLRLNFTVRGGCMVGIGGPVKRTRGFWYMAVGKHDLTWMHWRKAKNRMHRNEAREAAE